MANIHGNELGVYINKNSDAYDAFAAEGADLTTTETFTFDDDGDPDTAPSGVAAGEWILVACATNCSLNLSNATIETTCKRSDNGELLDSSVRHTISGQQTWNMSVDGLVDLGSGATGEESFAGLMDLAISRDEILVAFSTGVEGAKEYVGKGFISSIDASAGVDDFATYSCSIEGNGLLTARTTADHV